MIPRLLLLSALAAFSSCEASFPDIAGYSPQSLVTDQNAIDLDQKFIEDTLGAKNLPAARDFFEMGAHSGSYAVVTLDPPGITAAPPPGTEVVGTGDNGVETRGYLREAYEVGDTVLEIAYHVSDNQDSWVSCRVGALVSIEGAYKDGCFAEIGNMTLVDSNGGRQQSFTYSYNLRRDNVNSRTIFGFSSQAERRMKDCGPSCPYETFSKFYDYYGVADYANVWIEAAFGRTTTDFPGKGNQDFSLLGDAGIAEVIKKGTAYLSVWMHVIQKMEEAVNPCQDGCIDCDPQPSHNWDQAVAFYTGSLEGVDGSGSGVLLHALADKRCMDFKTCGRNGGELDGISQVNHDIFNLFSKGTRALEEGRCTDAKNAKRSIERLMAVPLIQGSLRYAYKRSLSSVEDDKEIAEGAVFAAAVLPILNNCSEPIADYVFENMKVGSRTPTDFRDIKGAFEQVYDCMEIDGAAVGGLWDTSSGEYFEGAEPVGAKDDGGSNAGLAVGLTIGILAALVIGTVVFRRYRRSSTSTAAPPTSMPPAVTVEGLT